MSFETDTESVFQKCDKPANAHQGEMFFRNTLLTISKKCTPAGRIPKIIPHLSDEAKQLMLERDKKRALNPISKEILPLSMKISKLIYEEKQIRWTEHLKTFSSYTDQSKLWKTIKGLNGKAKLAPNVGITFKNKTHNKGRQLVNMFNKQYTTIKKHQSMKTAQKITKALLSRKDPNPVQLTEKEVREAIKKSNNSKAQGPDKLTIFQ